MCLVHVIWSMGQTEMYLSVHVGMACGCWLNLVKGHLHATFTVVLKGYLVGGTCWLGWGLKLFCHQTGERKPEVDCVMFPGTMLIVLFCSFHCLYGGVTIISLFFNLSDKFWLVNYKSSSFPPPAFCRYTTELLEIHSEDPSLHILVVPGNPGSMTVLEYAIHLWTAS